jgi:hypothetical protein
MIATSNRTGSDLQGVPLIVDFFIIEKAKSKEREREGENRERESERERRRSRKRDKMLSSSFLIKSVFVVIDAAVSSLIETYSKPRSLLLITLLQYFILISSFSSSSSSVSANSSSSSSSLVICNNSLSSQFPKAWIQSLLTISLIRLIHKLLFTTNTHSSSKFKDSKVQSMSIESLKNSLTSEGTAESSNDKACSDTFFDLLDTFIVTHAGNTGTAALWSIIRNLRSSLLRAR